MSIFTNQGYLSITLDTGITITGATVKRILYTKPDGTSGYFTASASGTTALTYQFGNDDLDIAGRWRFQTFVTIGGLDAWGEIYTHRVSTPIPS